MKYTEQVLVFNNQMKDALTLIYNSLNQGQRKKILKDENIKALLTKYGVIND